MSIENAARARRFRETLWFKRGDAAPPPPPAADLDAPPADRPGDVVDTLPIEDRYHDDGTVTADDSKHYSLRTGLSQKLPTIAPTPAAGGISEREIIGEMRGSRVWLVATVAVVVAVLVGAILLAIA